MALEIFRHPKAPLGEHIKQLLKPAAIQISQVMAQVVQMEQQLEGMLVSIEMARQAGHNKDTMPIEQQVRMIQQRIDAGYHMINEFLKIEAL